MYRQLHVRNVTFSSDCSSKRVFLRTSSRRRIQGKIAALDGETAQPLLQLLKLCGVVPHAHERASDQAHPPARINESVKHPEGLPQSLVVVVFTSYVLGAVSEVAAGLPTVDWIPAITGAAIGCLFVTLHRFCHSSYWQQPAAPLRVVITGGTKGLGKALAREFLWQGDRVFIAGRTQSGVAKAIQQLNVEVQPEADIHGYPCDVSKPESIDGFIAAAREEMGGIDVWINNAGYSGSFQYFMSATDEQLERVISTNMTGSFLCSKKSIEVMQQQELGGHVFNMDGAGADGFPTPQYAAYGATKCGLAHLSKTLEEELRGSSVGFHTLSPGMMLTDLLLEGATDQNKQVFNILCEQPETVAAYLVPRVKSAVAHGTTGAYIKYLTPSSALFRFLTAPSRMNRFFDSDGNATYACESDRIMGVKSKVTQRLAAKARRRDTGLRLAYSVSLAVSVWLVIMESSSKSG